MFKKNRIFFIFYVVFITNLVFIATFTLLHRVAAQPQNIGFLHPPYFGTTAVTSIFDHEYPKYDDEIEFLGDDDLIITSTIRHNDGISYTNNIPGYSGHDGIDYGLRYQYVLASHTGTVQKSDWDSPANHRLRLGLFVQLETTHNGETYQTDYGHLSALWVSQGDVGVAAGDLLGISGSTGNSTGPHLHFSVHDTANADMNPYGWDGGAIVDPWSLVDGGKVSNNLWADRDGIDEPNDPPSISNSTVYSSGAVLALTFSDPRLTPDLTAPTTYILDDSDDEFTTIGLWQTETCAAATDCYEDEWHHTVISDVTVTWHPAAGSLYAQEYDLYAYIPQGATTTQASYRINHNSTSHWAGIRQNGFFASTNQRWAYIGRYEFTGDGAEYIQLTSKNEGIPGTGADEVTGADALAFVLVGEPPLPTPTPSHTPTTTSTPSPTSTPIPVSTPTPLPPSAAYITKVSLGSGGTNPAISGNGQYLAYYNNSEYIMRYDHAIGSPEQVVTLDGWAGDSIAISDDGNYIAYAAYGPDPQPDNQDVFLYDHTTGLYQNLTNHLADSTISLINNSNIKIVQLDESVLVGYTTATYFNNGNPTSYDIWLYNSAQSSPTLIEREIGSRRHLSDISADGNEFLIRGDHTLYIYNRVSTDLETISPPRSYTAMGSADFSSNGDYLTYNIDVDVCSVTCYYQGYVYWHDRVTNDTQEIYSGPSEFVDEHPRLSDNGRYVTYGKGTHNIYQYDRNVGDENQITLTADGSEGPNGSLYEMEVSGDGRFVAFSSMASNLVANDTNGEEDVFLADTDLLTSSPLPTATPGNPAPTPTPDNPEPTVTPSNPTPVPITTCFFGSILASNDLGNSGVVRHDGDADSSAQASANESLLQQGRQFLGKMLQTADMLTQLYRLRDDVMSQTETGLYYTDLYYTHSDELTDLVEADPVLFQEAHDTLLLFQPHLTDFLDGDGNSVIVTAADVQAVQSLLDQFAALGSPALQQTIAAEQARSPLAQFTGKTSNEVWDSLPPPPQPAIDIQINYQPASAPIPNGYLVDDGSVFEDRGNGYTYGWDFDITITGRDRDNSNSLDQRYDTLVHSQHADLANDAIWEIELPNGEYEVYLVAGDPSYYNSYYHMLAEGVSIIDASPSSETRWFEGTVTVVVSDGRLTITNGSSAQNNKFDFVHIRSLGTIPTATATNVPTVTATSTPLPIATHTATNTPTPTVTPIDTPSSTPTNTPTAMPSSTSTPIPMATITPVGTASAPIHINFQPASASIPVGYLVDNGAVFADRGNGFMYGWDIRVTNTTRDRNNSSSPDQRYDTLVHSQHPSSPGDAIWEIELPNGEYEIHFVAGDPSYFDSYYHILAEDITLINAAPSSGNRWQENTITITVGDGRLSLTNGPNADNNKFAFIDIIPR